MGSGSGDSSVPGQERSIFPHVSEDKQNATAQSLQGIKGATVKHYIPDAIKSNLVTLIYLFSMQINVTDMQIYII